jgi:hypothetical protein
MNRMQARLPSSVEVPIKLVSVLSPVVTGGGGLAVCEGQQPTVPEPLVVRAATGSSQHRVSRGCGRFHIFVFVSKGSPKTLY